jgi:hypothetical protein
VKKIAIIIFTSLHASRTSVRLLGTLFWMFSLKVIAQTPLSDSIKVTYPDSNRPRLSYAINWDARSSIIKEQRVNIWGVNTGIIVGLKRNQITIGYYWLNFNSYKRLLDLRKSAAKRVNLDYYTKTDLYFFSLMYWKNFVLT